MGRYINFLIKNDFHECSDFKIAKEYADGVFNQLKPEWEQMPYVDRESSAYIDADIELHFGDYAPWSFWMTLHNGYWAVETCINDYMINYHINDTASEVYVVPLQCQLICRALGQQEAWICFEDRLNNSADAPSDNLNAWFRYAEKVGIKDVTYEDFKNARIMPGKERNDLIVYETVGKHNKSLITSTSHPILHFRISDFEDMRIVLADK